MQREEIEKLILETGWFHSIDLGQGVVTPGRSNNEISRDLLPAVAGKSVLDIGAWDGLNSFWAEAQGARRVVAMDRYVWGVDIDARNRYWAECKVRGEMPDHSRDLRDFFDPTLPWKRGFDIAKQVLGSSVEAVVADIADVDPASLGTFDVTLCLGVIYHLPDPLGALTRLRQLTTEVAVIETEAVEVLGFEDKGVCEFLPGGELNEDFGNWFRLSASALTGMCRAAGFRKVEVVQGPPPLPPEPAPIIWRSSRRDRENHNSTQRARRAPQYYRVVAHAFP